MWWQLFFVLVATAAASEDDIEENSPDCLSLMHRECEAEYRSFPDISSSEEDIEEYCNSTVKYYECMNRFLNICERDVADYARFLAEDEVSARRICNEDAELQTTESEDDFEEDSPDCMRLIHRECASGNRPEEFPSNEEELEERCNNTLKHFECIERVLGSCGGQDTYFGRYLADMGATFRRVCNEDDVLRTAIVDNLPCYKENWNQITSCSAISIHRDSFFVAMNEIGITNVEGDRFQPYSCLDNLFNIGCSAASAGELCGNAARDILVNLLLGFDSLFEVCPPGSKEKYPEVVRVIHMEAEKRNLWRAH